MGDKSGVCTNCHKPRAVISRKLGLCVACSKARREAAALESLQEVQANTPGDTTSPARAKGKGKKQRKIYQRTCKAKSCKKKFTPISSTQLVCSVPCSIEYGRFLNEKRQASESRAKLKKWKEQTTTHRDWLKELQKVFNQFIRLRDANLGCISCGTSMSGRKGDASHFYSVGASPNLRFNEDNVHLACVPCNQFKHGNLIEYAARLPKRIGQQRFELLAASKNVPLKISIPEIKEKIKEYKNKIAQFKT